MNLKFKIQNSKLITLNSLLFFILIFCQLSTVNCQLSFAAYGDAKLTVNADVRAETLTLEPQASATPTPGEGQFYFDDTTSQPYYHNGTGWKVISGGAGGAGDKNVATKIVAAFDSQDKDTKADYVCDGVDDQVEIQAAIDALGTTGGTVYLLEGTYNITNTIKFDNIAPLDSAKSLIGAGNGTLLKVKDGLSDITVIKATSVNQIVIARLRINGSSGSALRSWGIYFTAVSNSRIEDITFEKFWDYGAIIFWVSANTNNVISNNYFNDVWYAIRFMGGALYNIISSNIFYKAATPFTSEGGPPNVNDYNIFSNNLSYYPGPGVVGGLSLYNINNSNFSHNIIYSATGSTLSFGRANNCITYNCLSEGEYGIFTNSVTALGSIISGNNIRCSKPIRFELGRNHVICNNVLYSTYMHGIYIATAGSGNNLVSSNNLVDGTIANETINNDNNYFIGNYIKPTATTLYSDSGTNTKYFDKTKLTMKPGVGYTIDTTGKLIPNEPTSYLRLNPTADVDLNGQPNIENGKFAGDILILENTTTFRVRVYNRAATKLEDINYLDLNQNDVLTLLWNGSAWIETGFADN